ncbi:unnamed protein product [Didymodactylos carnosus]|uniref:F-box domain-containing protein n=1 Tax=Didymodactylos carnosus TaxID=1234261 RepID=A0A813ZAE6_9BILA|nr:unnamed protein product [Didymodactylos carnosus]CAF0896578.1 unnamed protein product [Didymodactylos carnosus]CAF3616976.1 unnamed protein product [Didymodactylos carnosus]CAF3679802.1 unnamed protein product [Didymodactylos carnosus]
MINLLSLSNDLFYEIFDYLDVYDIYYSFGDLNKRLDSIIQNKSHLHAHITSSNFDCYLNYILPIVQNRLISLKFEIPFDKIKLFTSIYPLNQFNRLYSLSLKIISTSASDDNLLLLVIAILKQLSFLKYLLSLTFDFSTSFYKDRFSILALILSYLPKLKYLSCDINSCEYFERLILNEIEEIKIFEYYYLETLKINLIDINHLLKFINCFPKLKHLSLHICSVFSQHGTILSLPHVKINCLLSEIKYLNLNAFHISFHHIQQLLKLCPNLIVFTFSSKNWIFIDGEDWMKLLSIFKLIKFRLYINTFFRPTVKIDIYRIQKTFQTQFWLEKNWHILCDYDHINGQHIKIYSIK